MKLPTQHYDDWIATHVLGDGEGACEEWTRLMQQAFPELRRVGGLIFRVDVSFRASAALGPAQHWWLVTPAGTIIDPTGAQFPWPKAYIPYEPATCPGGLNFQACVFVGHPIHHTWTSAP